MLGIARTTGDPGARSASSAAMVTPAAIDSTRLGPLAASARHTVATSAGFTAITLPSAAVGSSTTSTPGKASCSAAIRPWSGSTMRIPSSRWPPAVSKPPTSASPMRPPPITWSTI